MAETAGLVAIAVNFQRLIRFSGGDEAGQDHSIHADLARADGVEESHERNGQLKLLVIGEAEKLVDAFGIGVAPAREFGCAHQHIIILAKRHARAFAINFR